MGSISVRHRELLLSWDQKLRGVMKQPSVSLDLLSLLSGTRLPGLTLSLLLTVLMSQLSGFCCLFTRGWRFSSETAPLLLCDKTRGLFLGLLCLWVNFCFPARWLRLRRGTSTWCCSALYDAHVTCVPSSLLLCRMLDTDSSGAGDVCMVLSITPSERGLDKCSESKALSSFRASSSMCPCLPCSSLRPSRLLFKFCRCESSSATVSPFYRV